MQCFRCPSLFVVNFSICSIYAVPKKKKRKWTFEYKKIIYFMILSGIVILILEKMSFQLHIRIFVSHLFVVFFFVSVFPFAYYNFFSKFVHYLDVISCTHIYIWFFVFLQKVLYNLNLHVYFLFANIRKKEKTLFIIGMFLFAPQMKI